MHRKRKRRFHAQLPWRVTFTHLHLKIALIHRKTGDELLPRIKAEPFFGCSPSEAQTSWNHWATWSEKSHGAE